MYRLSILALLLLTAQTPVPTECMPLAAREGFPTDVLNNAQVKAARKRMAWLRVRHPFDPMVKTCREAIKAVK